MAPRRQTREVMRGDLEPARIRLGLTQLEIADQLGVHERTWRRWVGGERACPWSVWLAIGGLKPARGKGVTRKPRAVKKGA